MRIAITAASVALALLPRLAAASAGGVASGGCGCHGGGSVGIDLDAASSIAPGQTVTMTTTISASAAEAGLFVQATTGDLATLSGQGMASVSAGLTHVSPRAMSSGEAQISFRWTAPDGPGAVRMGVWAVAANGNNNNGGDQWSDEVFDFVYGCEAQTYYRDLDGDGYGVSTFPRDFCADSSPAGYAPLPDDCNDNRAQTHPGATEFCNQIDDDCDDETDENAVPLALYRDADGDGFYGADEFAGDMMMGCVPTEGWAAEPGDCRPEDPTVHPGIEEVCNGFDDDCDTDVDERVQPQCGVGWCRRESYNCTPEGCTPGEPREETCNFFDDDCDGIIDEDTPCPEGESCQAGECRPIPEDDGLDESGSDTGGLDTEGTDSTAGQQGGSGGCGCRSNSGDFGGVAAFWLLLLAAPARRMRGRP
ncbi:MAG: choice-of-anchor V domain-containing protein [Myxococcota bacterium]